MNAFDKKMKKANKTNKLMKQEEVLLENQDETRNRIFAVKLGITYEELTQTGFEIDSDEYDAFGKIIFNPEESPTEILDKIGLQDEYWIIVDSISIPDEIEQNY